MFTLLAAALLAGCALVPSPVPPPLAEDLVETHWRLTEVDGE